MPATRFARTRRWFGRLWWFVDGSRRVVLNLLFLLLLAVLVFALLRGGPAALQDKTALVLALKGPLVEQRSGGFRDNALSQARGDDTQSTRLRDVLAVIDAAAADPKIARVVLLLDDLQGAGLPMLREVAAALQRFKAAGKAVVAWGSGYDQRQYYLAAHADAVFLHPFGSVYLDGFGGYRNYYRDALDRLGVDVTLVRVGTYKSAAEPYIANGPSEAAQQADAFLYQGLWATYTEGVEAARKLPAGGVMKMIDELPQRLAAAGGDAAKLALAGRWVDGLKTRDELRQWMIESGAKDTDGKTFRQVSFGDYLGRVKPPPALDKVGVVVAEGAIVDGQAPGGTVGGLSTANLVRKAREDDHVKALVLRVNSPGGSVFGSELVRRELELTRAAGKPVVVSMGNVAASGGYWISLAADEVIADAATVTGSIGVFGLMPNVSKTLDKLGVHAAGTTTTWLRAAADPRVPADPRFLQVLQTSIDHVYADFTAKVAQARKSTPEKIDAIAQGRVWTGLQAKERGLIDTIGDLHGAIASAAKRAKLGDEKSYAVAYVEREPGKVERLLDLVGGGAVLQAVAAVVADRLNLALVPAGMPTALLHGLQADLAWLADLVNPTEGRPPFAALAHCFCVAP